MNRMWWVVGGLFFLLVIGLGAIAIKEGVFEQRGLLDYGQVSPLVLSDSKGQPFSLGTLRGQVWVASFFFSRCTTICPAQNQKLLSLYRSYELDPMVRFVSVSVDPAYDTPPVLQAYQRMLGVQSKKWTFLTGNESDVVRASEQVFKLAAKAPDFHSTKVALVDAHQTIRGYYDLQVQADVRQLFKDIALLAAQARQESSR
ncbi:MAG: SCO family protein [Candidatus Margulisiibacteriota bacterium]